jgi:protein involved in polysaccharide export with SLBB domain
VPRIARISAGCLVAVALGFALSGCSSALQLSSLDELSSAMASPGLRAGERISVTVYGEASLSGNYVIDPTGVVSIPLAGRIKAVGLTTVELAEILVKKFRGEYLRDPKVTVSRTEVRAF